MSGSLLRARGLSFRYSGSEKNGIQEINFDIGRGELILLAGDSGSGKSTLLKILCGLIPRIVEGEIQGTLEYESENLFEIPMHRLSRMVGCVFQNPRSQFFTTHSTAEIVFPMENFGIGREEMLRRVDAITRRFALSNLLDRDLLTLSSGERQKLALAIARSMDQPLVLFDEPSANLDYGNAMALSQHIRELKREGVTVVIADHRFYYLRGLVDRVFLMQEGSIEIYGSESEFLGSDYETRSFDLFAIDENREPAVNLQRPVASIRELHYSTLLEKVGFDLCSGQIVALVGANGVGKTTLARLLMGSLKPDAGRIDIPKGAFFVMQDADYQLFGTSVFQELKISPHRVDDAQIHEILTRLDLDHRRDAHPFDLSGGEKQRLQIAMASLSGCSLLIFDEPTSGLDIRTMRSVVSELNALKKEAAVLVVTHDYEFIRRAADRIIYLQNRTVADDFPLTGERIDSLNRIFHDMEELYVQA